MGHALTAAALVAPIFFVLGCGGNRTALAIQFRTYPAFPLAGLPIEEWLFFLTVPLPVSLYGKFSKPRIAHNNGLIKAKSICCPDCLCRLRLFSLSLAKIYGLALLAFGVAVAGDRIVKSNILQQKRTAVFLSSTG
jgi:hypothetical protein